MREKLLELKNKEFILECLKIIENNGNNTHINILTNPFECKRRFDMNYPVLQEVSLVGTIDKAMYLDRAGNRRYYPDIITLFEKRYIICNDWYYKTRANTRDTRSNFVDFVLDS